MPLGPKLWSIAEACCQQSRGSLADSQRCQRRQCTALAVDVIRHQTVTDGPPAAANSARGVSWALSAFMAKHAILSSSCRQTQRAYGVFSPPFGQALLDRYNALLRRVGTWGGATQHPTIAITNSKLHGPDRRINDNGP